MKRLMFIVGLVVMFIIVGSGGKTVLSQATSTPSPVGPKKLSGFVGANGTAAKFGGPNKVPFETDPFVVDGIQVMGFMSGPYIDLAKTDPTSGCFGFFPKTPTYRFNLEVPIKVLSISFVSNGFDQDPSTQASLVVSMPDGSLYCSGALTNNPSVTINGNTTSASVTVWIGVTPGGHASGKLLISQNEVSTAGTAASKSAMLPTTLPTSDAPVITYEQSVHSEFTTSVGEVTYTLAGVKGDVVEALLQSTVPKGAPVLMNPNLFVKTDSGTNIVAPSQDGSSYGDTTRQSSDGGSIYIQSFFFQLPKDGPTMLTVKRFEAKQVGSNDLILHKIPVLAVDNTVKATVTYKALSTDQPVATYAFMSTGLFSIEYRVTGKLNVTAAIGQALKSGAVRPLSFLGGSSTDSFAPKNDGTFHGGMLYLEGTGQVFVITIGNSISRYDESQVFFTKGADTDTADYELTLRSLNAATPATSVMPPTLAATPAVTTTMVTRTILAGVKAALKLGSGNQWKFSTTSPNIALSMTLTKTSACPIAVSIVNDAHQTVFSDTIKVGIANYTTSVTLPTSGVYWVVITVSNEGSAPSCTSTDSNPFSLTLTSAG